MTAELNSLFMYLVAGGIILFVALVCVIFMVRAYRAGKAIGMEVKVLKRTITSSATFSVLPAVAILFRGHYTVRKPRNALALAQAFGHRRAAL